MEQPSGPGRRALDFTELGRGAPGAPAICHPEGRPLDYRHARQLVARARGMLDWPAKALVAVTAPRTLAGLLGYLAALAAGHTVVLVEEKNATTWPALIAAYQPDLLVTAPGDDPGADAPGFRPRGDGPISVWHRASPPANPPLHPELALIMRTSGSLGRPKTVRLSYENLRANALAIAEALRLSRGDRCVTSLPLDFCYGLSLVNSHLAAGGSVALCAFSPSSEQFWQYVDEAAASCIGAVPSTYRWLRSTRWDPRPHRSLRRLLHSGGPLDAAALAHFDTLMTEVGGEFISMYGQTEATARIACLPAELAAAHRGSVGLPIPGGRVRIERPGGGPAADGEVGEIVYFGPSVMMGYAATRADLAQGRQQGPALHTGDFGCVRDGFLYVTGRTDRQVKVFGRRIDLEQAEKLLQARGITAALEAVSGERMVVASELTADQLTAECRFLAAALNLPSASLSPCQLDAMPYTNRGKIDHAAIRREVAGAIKTGASSTQELQ